MKKLLALLLAIVMVFSLFVACSNDKDDEDDDKKASEEKTSSVTTKELMGEIDGNVYENTFIGIGCRLPDSWTYLSQSELNEMNGIVMDIIDDEALTAYLDASVFYSMMATSGFVDNCNINLEKVSSVTLESMDVAEYLEESMPTLEQTYDSMGATNFQYEITTVKLDGKVVDCIYTNVSLNGVDMVQCVIVLKCDGYLANISLTAYSDKNLEALLGYFYWL